METNLFFLSLVAAAGSLLASWFQLFQASSSGKKTWLYFLRIAVLLHMAGFAWRNLEFWTLAEQNRYYFAVHTFFGALCYLALISNIFCLYVAQKYKVSVLGSFVLPLSTATQAAALLFFNPQQASLNLALRSQWMYWHPLILMTSYGALINAFGISAAFLIQQWQIKSRRPHNFSWQMPSLEILDKLSCRLILFALPLLLVGIVMGGAWAKGAWGRFWGWDPKEIASLVTVAIYSAHLALRWRRMSLGRLNVWLNWAGFASIFLGFFWANIFSKVHSHLSD